LGAILFAAGWWTALSAPATPRMTLAQAAAVLALVLVLCLIQIPRAQQQLIQAAPAFAPDEARLFPSPALLAGRARYFKSEFHDRQLRALARLDLLDELLSDLQASPESLRDVFGPIRIPGISEKQLHCDAFSLLSHRPRNKETLSALAARSPELVELLRPEPESPPPWLTPVKRPSPGDKRSQVPPRRGAVAPPRDLRRNFLERRHRLASNAPWNQPDEAVHRVGRLPSGNSRFTLRLAMRAAPNQRA
jgi:hypothetical protein